MLFDWRFALAYRHKIVMVQQDVNEVLAGVQFGAGGGTIAGFLRYADNRL